MNLLNLTWYYEDPFDYELKQYVLLGYLRDVEDCFLKKKLSPHLLHLEKLQNELVIFKNGYDLILNNIQEKYKFFKNDEKPINNDRLSEIYNVVEFSIPQIKSKIEMGYIIFKKNNQLLY